MRHTGPLATLGVAAAAALVLTACGSSAGGTPTPAGTHSKAATHAGPQAPFTPMTRAAMAKIATDLIDPTCVSETYSTDAYGNLMLTCSNGDGWTVYGYKSPGAQLNTEQIQASQFGFYIAGPNFDALPPPTAMGQSDPTRASLASAASAIGGRVAGS